ncbi:MAG: hypothetical protein H7Y11_07515, partial [Armatimonadetes bacterium]|nr:hypothetical protein [Anaerolineae bacterium]
MLAFNVISAPFSTAQQQPIATPVALGNSAIVASSTNYGTVRAFPMADIVNNLGIGAWRRQGWSGLDVKVGVIDVGFGGITDFEARENTQVIIPDVKEDYQVQLDRHGTEVLEVIRGIAPGAPLYACGYTDFDGYQRCVSWMISSKVRIINHSVGVPALPLDGSNAWAQQVERAAGEEILWVNAAGNFNKGYIKGTYTPFPNTPYNVFLGGGQFGDTLQIPQISETSTLGRVLLSWEGVNNVAANAIDLDLELYYSDSTEPLYSQGRQSGALGDVPLELLSVDISRPFYIKIRDISGIATGARYVLFIEFADIPGGETQQS